MEEIEPIGKDSFNAKQGFKYRSVDAVMNALQPLFAKHKLFCVPEVIESSREERQSKGGGILIYSIIRTKYTFYAEDGSFVSAIVEGEGMDSADKSTNKALAIAFKYACFQLFCIPTEETSPDPDGTTPEPKGKHETSKKQPENPKVVCDKCGSEIKGVKKKDGTIKSAEEVKKACNGLCLKCYKEQQKTIEEVEVENE